NHRKVLEATEKLAKHFERLKKWDECIELRKENLQVLEQARGEKHIDALDACVELAETYLSCGRFIPEQELRTQAVDGYAATLGTTDSRTMLAKCTLAKCLHNQRRYSEALAILDQDLNDPQTQGNMPDAIRGDIFYA